MSLGIALLFVTAVGAAQSNDALVAEAQCIPNALTAQVQAKQQLQIEGPTAACKARYGWTAEETDAALAIANASGNLMGDAHRLQMAGVDLDLIEQIFDQVSPADVAALGTYHDTKDAEHLAAENNARMRIANLVSPRVREDAQVPMQMAVADRCIARNTLHAFAVLRGQRH